MKCYTKTWIKSGEEKQLFRFDSISTILFTLSKGGSVTLTMLLEWCWGGGFAKENMSFLCIIKSSYSSKKVVLKTLWILSTKSIIMEKNKTNKCRGFNKITVLILHHKSYSQTHWKSRKAPFFKFSFLSIFHAHYFKALQIGSKKCTLTALCKVPRSNFFLHLTR